MSTTPSPPEKTEDSSRAIFVRLLLLALTVFIDILGFGIVLPNLPHYIEMAVTQKGAVADHGSAAFIGGLLGASYSFTQFLCAPFWGRVSDRQGRRPVILLSLLGVGISYILFALADGHLWMLFAARLTAGFLSSASIGVAFAYVADVTTPENRARGIGLLGACFGMGFLLGPTLGGFLGQVSPVLPAYVAAALALANFIASFFLLPESLSAEERAKRANSSPFTPALLGKVVTGPAGFLFLISFIVTFGFSALEQLFGFYLLSVPGFHVTPETQPKVFGLILGLIGIISVIVQGGLIGPIVKRFGEPMTARIGIGLMAIGFVLFTIPRDLWLFAFLPSPFLAVGRALVTPAISALVSRKAQLGQGLTQSVSQSFDALARTVGPVTAGFLFSRFTPQTPFYATAIAMCIALGIAWMRRAEMSADGDETTPADMSEPRSPQSALADV